MVILVESCNSDNSVAVPHFKASIPDTLDYSYKRHLNLVNALSLSDISQGVDSFELRIWSSLGATDLAILTILKFVDSTWQLTETQYWISYINRYPKADKIVLDSLITKRQNPSTSFSNILDSIKHFNLDTIPNQSRIPGFRDRTADGMGYTIEFAKKDIYNLVFYHNPNRYKDSINKNVTETLNFFQRNLNVFVPNF